MQNSVIEYLINKCAHETPIILLGRGGVLGQGKGSG